MNMKKRKHRAGSVTPKRKSPPSRIGKGTTAGQPSVSNRQGKTGSRAGASEGIGRGD